ncbi:MAG: hypothetical protein GY797_38410 [Deltaproteobacteria bacterium]|nr:hypothetical protein [Deltaproteobacteria bacterium]
MNRKKLLDVLKKVKPGIADKDIVESMTYFYFSGKEVVTYNDKISILHPLETEFNLFVKADDLYKIVSLSKAEKLKIVENGTQLNIRSAQMNVNLTTIIDEEIVDRIGLIEKSLKDVKWKKLPSNFMESATLCSFAAAKIEAESTLSCVYIKGEKIMAFNNDQFASATLKGKVSEMFLKASQLSNLVSIEPELYVVTKAWLHFKSEDGCVFSIRRIDGDFPEKDMEGALDFEGRSVDLSTDILEGADIASIFVDTMEPVISVKITKGKCIVSVTSEGGGSQHRSKLVYEGPDIEFNLNPDFLREMLAHSTTITVDDDSTKAKLSTENFTMMTSLKALEE